MGHVPRGWSAVGQELRAGGFNAAIVCIAADGGSLAALDDWGSSPRYDSGLLAASGADPRRKDVLEALLRIFDREGLRLIPAIELAAPLPRARDAATRGRSASHRRRTDCLRRAHVERALSRQADRRALQPADPRGAGRAGRGDCSQLVARYGHHPSLAGVALQLSGRGYGVLPGLRWGMDDATAPRFAADTQVALPDGGHRSLPARGPSMLTGPERTRWIAWRQAELTRFYAELAAAIAAEEADRQLVLCTENLFAGAEAGKALRQAVSGRASLDDAAAELGVDLEALAAAPGVCLLRPRRLASDEDLESRALDLLVNSSAELDHAVADQPRRANCCFTAAGACDWRRSMPRVPSAPTRPFSRRACRVFHGRRGAAPLATALAGARLLTRWSKAPSCCRWSRRGAGAAATAVPRAARTTAEVRVERSQPVTMRVYRAGEATTVCLINESPWPVEVQVPLETSGPAAWRDLGGGRGRRLPTGTLPSGASSWKVELPPYGIAARRFDSRQSASGTIVVKPGGRGPGRARRADRRDRAADAGLDVERPYEQLQNPDFELVGPRRPDARLAAADQAGAGGDRRRRGASGRAVAASGERRGRRGRRGAEPPVPHSRHGAADRAARACARPTWRRRSVCVDRVRSGAGDPARVAGAQDSARPQASGRRARSTFDDLPLGGGGQMRVQFHLAGPRRGVGRRRRALRPAVRRRAAGGVRPASCAAPEPRSTTGSSSTASG